MFDADAVGGGEGAGGRALVGGGNLGEGAVGVGKQEVVLDLVHEVAEFAGFLVLHALAAGEEMGVEGLKDAGGAGGPKG